MNEIHRFFSENEVERIKKISPNAGGTCYREIATYCLHEITEANKAGEIDSRTAMWYKQIVLKLRAAMATLYDFNDIR